MDEFATNPRRLKLVSNSSRTLEFQVFESRIADYVAGTLGAVEQEAFEEALLANPDWAQWVEVEELMRSGIKTLAVTEPQLFLGASPQPALAPAAADTPLRWRGRGQRWLSGIAIAATVTFAALFVQARQQIGELQGALDAAQSPIAQVAFIRLDEMRGAAPAPSAQRPSDASTVVLEIPAGPDPLEAYRVRLLRDGEIVWDLSPVRADADGFLLISIPGAKLPAGKYRAVLTATAELSMPVGSYEFAVQ
jgi:hypothetical protein